MNKEMKEFYGILEKRFSVRQYLKKPVPSDVIDRILKTGNEAASAANKQPWAFILCQGEDKTKINDVFYRDGFKDAPVAIVAVADLQNAWVRRNDGKNYAYVDTTIAVTEMILAATAEGLGTCWIAAFDYEKAKEILDIPEGMEIVTLVTIGYIPEDIKQPERSRKPMENILHIGKYSKNNL